MSDPVSVVFHLLDKGVEKIADRAFDSAVAEQQGETSAEHPTSQEELLQEVDAGQADADAPDVREAIASELVEKDNLDGLQLTPLGKYLAPEPDEAQGDKAESAEQQAQAVAS